MATAADVRDELTAGTPDYPALAARFGPDVAPVLRELAAGADTVLAARAVALAGQLPPAAAATVVLGAAGHDRPEVRVAAARLVGRLGAAAREPAAQLLGDSHAEVRCWTLRSLERHPSGPLRDQLASLAAADPVPRIREQAVRVACGIGR